MSRRLHALYRLTERAKRWVSSRFTETGKLFLMIAGVAFFFGVGIQSSMIYQIFAAVGCLLAFSFLATLRFHVNLKIDRILPDTCIAGKTFKYQLLLDNCGKKSEKALLYREASVVHLPDLQEFTTSREEGEEKRNIFDRKMGYYRWLWLLSLGKMLESHDQELPELVPGRKKKWEIKLLPLKRGNIHLRGALTRIDPFGLCKREVDHLSPHNLLVLPKLYPMPQLFSPGSRKYHQGGITAAQDRGDSNEFLSLREYNAGDPIKHIDWKSTARSGRTIVKQYRDEYFSRYGLVLDSFTSKPYSEVFEEAVSVAASILMTQDSENTVLDLLIVGSECVTCSVGRGLADKRRMLEILAAVSTCREAQFSELADLVKSHLHLLSGIVFVLIDLDEQRRDLINSLVRLKIPVKPIIIVEDKEGYAAKKQMLKVDIPIQEIDCSQVEEQIALL